MSKTTKVIFYIIFFVPISIVCDLYFSIYYWFVKNWILMEETIKRHEIEKSKGKIK